MTYKGSYYCGFLRRSEKRINCQHLSICPETWIQTGHQITKIPQVDQYMKTVTNLINSQTEDVSKEVVALWGRWWVLSDLRTFFICMSFILKDLFYSRVTVFSATKLCYQNTFTAIHWKLIQSCQKMGYTKENLFFRVVPKNKILAYGNTF